MKKLILIISALFCLTSCNWRATYPAIGAGTGAGVGSLGGPGGAVLGGVVGSSVGTAMMEQGEHGEMEEKICEVKDRVEALSKGDVEALIKLNSEAERTGFEKIIDGIYQLMILAAIGAALWVVLPFLYRLWSKHLHKKIEKKITEGD